jgi:Predicted membrane protein (DUF2207) C-terminal domain/Predicted membrane protein (DUF2207) N-terminal domain
MIHKLILAFSLLMLLLAQRQAVPAKDYTAEHYDADIVVKEGGTLIVTETVTFKFVGGPFTYVFRNIPTDKTDGITIMSASMDDQSMQHGSGAGQVEITYGNPVKVTWHFAPVSDQTHTFVLTYQVLGVFQKTQDADVLNWIALPNDYTYAIGSSTITVSYPEQAILIGTPEVVQGPAQLTKAPGAWVFSAYNLKPKTRLEIGLKFRSGSVITQAPQWQRLQELSIALIPPFLLGGLAIFVFGSLCMIWYYRRYRRQPAIIEGETFPVTTPPDDLPPAIAGALLVQTPNWNNALSTLFDLAKREVLSISQSDEPKKWYKAHPEFLIELQTQPPDLRPHELGLLALLFETKYGMESSTSISKISRTYTSRHKRFTDPLKLEMSAMGILDAERQHIRIRFLVISLLLLILGCIAMALCLLFGIPTGTWPSLFLPLGVIGVSITVAVLWGMFSTLSEAGMQDAARWRAFSHYLRDITRGKELDIPQDVFERYLMYAATFGLAEKWVKYFQKQGMAVVPLWFHSLATSNVDNLSNFVTMIAVSHAVGGSSGAGGGGGAAGGGASGAG